MSTRSRVGQDRIIDIRDSHFESERSLLPLKALAIGITVAALAYGANEGLEALQQMNEDIRSELDDPAEADATPTP